MKSTRQRLACLLLASLACLAFLRAAGPPEGGAFEPAQRHIFLVDQSFSMSRYAAGVKDAMFDLIKNGAGGKMKTGDLIEVWTFDEDVHLRPVNPQVWMPELNLAIANRLTSFFRQLKFERQTRVDRALDALNRVAANSRSINAYLLTDGGDELRGSPFDNAINLVLKRELQGFRRSRAPFIIQMESLAGAWVSWSITTPGRSQAIASVDPLPVGNPSPNTQPEVVRVAPAVVATDPPVETPKPRAVPVLPARPPETSVVEIKPAVVPKPPPAVIQEVKPTRVQPDPVKLASPAKETVQAPPRTPLPETIPAISSSAASAANPIAPTAKAVVSTPPSPDIPQVAFKVATAVPETTTPRVPKSSAPPEPVKTVAIPTLEPDRPNSPAPPRPTPVQSPSPAPERQVKPQPGAPESLQATNAKPLSPPLSQAAMAEQTVSNRQASPRAARVETQRAAVKEPAPALHAEAKSSALTNPVQPSKIVATPEPGKSPPVPPPLAMTQDPAGPGGARWIFAGLVFLGAAGILLWRVQRGRRPAAATSLISRSIDHSKPGLGDK